MKAILLSIRPEHAVNILNGKKTLEIRKSVPKDFVGWVYGYVTKGKPFLMHAFDNTYYSHDMTEKYRMKNDLNGTIPFRFWFDEFIDLHLDYNTDYKYYWYDLKNSDYTDNQKVDGLLDKMCITGKQFYDYCDRDMMFAWHIKKLEIFDKPMQLREFRKKDLSNVLATPTDWPIIIDKNIVKHPPQSFQYVWVKE